MNLSKETQIDTLKEKRVLRIERDRRKEREEGLQMGGITQDICNVYTPPEKTNISAGQRTESAAALIPPSLHSSSLLFSPRSIGFIVTHQNVSQNFLKYIYRTI